MPSKDRKERCVLCAIQHTILTLCYRRLSVCMSIYNHVSKDAAAMYVIVLYFLHILRQRAIIFLISNRDIAELRQYLLEEKCVGISEQFEIA